MQRLGRFMSSSVKSLKADKAVRLHRLKSAWLKAVGTFMGTQTEPVKIQKDILFLVVSSPAWAQEIKLQQRLILKNLAKALQEKPLHKIVCWVGQPHTRQESTKTEVAKDESDFVPWKDVPIPADREAAIEETVSSLDDDGMREKLRKLLQLSVRREIYLVAQGQLPCPICGNFRPPEEDLCRDCRRERKERFERSVMRLLVSKPWLSAEDIEDRTGLRNRQKFLTIRKKLLGNLMLSAWQRTSGLKGEELQQSMDSPLRSLLLDITMLRCSLPFNLLQPKHFYFALGKRLAHGYLGTDAEQSEES